MRFVASGLATPAAPLEEDVRAAARVGADGLELARGKLAAALERAGPAGLAALLRRQGVRAVSIAAVEDVTFRDREGAEMVTEAVHRTAETARALGAAWIVVTPGDRPDGADERDATREACATLERLARLGERYDVGLALQPRGHPLASVRTLAQALAVVERVGRRALGLAPDTFECWAAGVAPEELTRCHPRWLAMLRVADAVPDVAPEGARAHHRRPPATGVVPLVAWVSVALALVPDLPVTCPVPAPEAPPPEPEAWTRRLRERVVELGREAAARR